MRRRVVGEVHVGVITTWSSVPSPVDRELDAHRLRHKCTASAALTCVPGILATASEHAGVCIGRIIVRTAWARMLAPCSLSRTSNGRPTCTFGLGEALRADSIDSLPPIP